MCCILKKIYKNMEHKFEGENIKENEGMSHYFNKLWNIKR